MVADGWPVLSAIEPDEPARLIDAVPPLVVPVSPVPFTTRA